MFNSKDPNSFTQYYDLYKGANNLVGNLIVNYQVTKYDDVQLNGPNSVDQPKNRQFIVRCSQRIILFNPEGLDINPNNTVDSFENYPVLLNTHMKINPFNGLNFQLLDYSPKTVNTQVQNSGTTGSSSGQTSGSSTSSTVGSSTSQTNSFNASISLTGDVPGASIGADHSSTSSQEHSNTHGTESSSSKTSDSSETSSMSMKDWGTYALANPSIQSPVWVIGQEYPWSAIDCRKTDDGRNPKNDQQTHLIVPSYMLLRLFDQTDGKTTLYPPSQLSAFGSNFITKAAWLVTLDDDAPDEVVLSHLVNYFSASHSLDDQQKVQVYMDAKPTELQSASDSDFTTSLNLPIVAMDILGGSVKEAILGFVPNKFTVKPAPVDTTNKATGFKILSGANNLLIEDTTSYPDTSEAPAGFTAKETAMIASFSNACPSLSMTLYFKIVDSTNDYKLYLKHWKAGPSDLKLTFIINGDKDNPIVKYVDATEAEGGENNVLSFSLRNLDFASVDYSDYLQLGLNAIEMTITPVDSKDLSTEGYALRALSIE